MANQSGQLYGLTILSPILGGYTKEVAHDMILRKYLSHMPNGEHSPFAKVPGTHFARLVVMDDVVFVGSPTQEEHLNSAYLVFTSDFDGDLDNYLQSMASVIPEVLDAIWSNCVGYPGAGDVGKFTEYMKKCQVTTTFYFADVNDKTLGQTLTALMIKSEVADFIALNQGQPAATLQQAFGGFMAKIEQLPPPKPGAREVLTLRAAGATQREPD
jgi:hypothetical protein